MMEKKHQLSCLEPLGQRMFIYHHSPFFDNDRKKVATFIILEEKVAAFTTVFWFG